MKRVLLISIALSFLASPLAANAYTVETVSTSDTGGITTKTEAVSTGSSDASAEVHSVVEGSGSGANVNINIRTSADGEEYATSVSKTIEAGGRVELYVGTPGEDLHLKGEISTSVPSVPEIYEMPSVPAPADAAATSSFSFSFAMKRISEILEHIFSFMFFFN